MFTPIGVVLVSLLLILNIFHTLFSVSTFNFENVIADWETNQDLDAIKMQRLKNLEQR